MAVFAADELLDMAMRVEQNGQAFYEAAAKKASTPETKDLLQKLAAWEVEHYQLFKGLAEQLGALEPAAGAGWQDYDLYLQAALGNALFQGADKAVALANELDDELDVLRMALGFEKDSLLFYHDIREMLPEAHHGVINQIIGEEKRHATLLAKQIRSGESAL